MIPKEVINSQEQRSPYLSKWNAIFDRNYSQWISFKPKQGGKVYPCYSCRDMFGSKNSFLDHVNRRGMLIQYKCPSCPQRAEFTFYNPCSFLLHAREHFNNTIGQVDLNNVTISIVPVGLAGFFQHPDIPMLYNVDEDNVGENEILNARFYTPSADSEGKRVVTLRPWQLLFYQPATPTTQVDRLILKQLSSNIPYCKFVEFVGTNPNTPVGSDIHIKEELNEIDESLPKCSECLRAQKGSMTEHFVENNKPCNESFKCSICKYIAATMCSLKAHERIHSGLSPFICPECGKNFLDHRLLLEHMDEICFHLAKHVRYRCPGRNCSKIFAASITFASHFPIHIQSLHKCSKCQTYFEDERDFKKHNLVHSCTATTEMMYKCRVCKNSRDIFSKDNFLEHINTHCTDFNQRVYVFTCKHCKNYFRSRETYAIHLLKCSKVKKQEIKPVEVVDDSDEQVNCVLCNEQFSITEIGNHLRFNQCNNENIKRCKYQNPIVILDLDDNHRKRRNSTTPNSKAKKVNVEEEIEGPIVFSGTYYCKLCDYKGEDRSAFHEHIIPHRHVSTSYQCMECGECFIVKPSLSKHLTFIHQIKDLEKYFEENNCCDKEAVKELEEIMNGVSSEPVGENQCRVCRLQCSSDVELNKHFRGHGMAFLMTNKK